MYLAKKNIGNEYNVAPDVVPAQNSKKGGLNLKD